VAYLICYADIQLEGQKKRRKIPVGITGPGSNFEL